MSRRFLTAALVCTAIALGACHSPGVGPATHAGSAPGRDERATERQDAGSPEGRVVLTTAAPPAGLSPTFSWPVYEPLILDGGLRLVVAQISDSPLASVRLVVGTGAAADADKRGLAALTASLVAEGGSGPHGGRGMSDRWQALGARLESHVTEDFTEWSVVLPGEHVEEALELLGLMARKARLPLAVYSGLWQQALERIRALETSGLAFTATWVRRRELFDLPTEPHPYARVLPSSNELQALQPADCVRWYRTHVTPLNAVLLVAGPSDADALRRAAEQAFRGWSGAAPEPPAFGEPFPPQQLKIYVADHPGSDLAVLELAAFVPRPGQRDHAALSAAARLLQGPAQGRLGRDVSARVGSRATGPTTWVLTRHVQTQEVGRELARWLQAIAALADRPPLPKELHTVVEQLEAAELARLESVESLTALLRSRALLGLPEDHPAALVRDWQALSPREVSAAVGRHLPKTALLVAVSGDAKRIARPLSRFGAVEVVDPAQKFTVRRRLARDPSASLDVQPNRR